MMDRLSLILSDFHFIGQMQQMVEILLADITFFSLLYDIKVLLSYTVNFLILEVMICDLGRLTYLPKIK